MKKFGQRKREGGQSLHLEQVDPRITYISALPPASGKITPIQGFSKERADLHWVWSLMAGLPSTIYELAGPRRATTGLRLCGMAAWRHLPIRIDRLLPISIYETSPLCVVFSADPGVAQLVSAWAARQSLPPLHISTQQVPGAILPSDLTIARLRRHCRELVSASGGSLRGFGGLISQWRARKPKSVKFPFLGHMTISPNQICLQANGMIGSEFIPHWRGATEQEFQDAIARSFYAVRNLRFTTNVPSALALMPPRSSIWLIAPSWLPDLRNRLMKFAGDQTDRTAVSAFANRIERQSGFVVSDEPGALERLEGSPTALELHEIRRLELGLFSDAIGWAIAGTAAGAWRMKPSINRLGGLIRQFAENIRAEAGTSPSKVAGLLEAIQHRMLASLDERAIREIQGTNWGMKVVCDMPVEWLPVGGLPLGLHCDVSRLTATPANLLLQQLETHEMLRLAVSDFDEILIVSAFFEGSKDDLIARVVTEAFDIRRIRLCIKRIKSEAEFIDAVNGYEGPLMIFDGHGIHPLDDEAYLVVGEDQLRVSALEGKVRMPPIVILSACDTHAAARPTTTVANAMLRLGARTVLGTNLPVRFDQAAMMIGDLIRTLDAYLPFMSSDIGRVVRWSEFVGAHLRAHFIAAVVFRVIEMKNPEENVMKSLLPNMLLAARFRTGGEAVQLLEDEVVGKGILNKEAFTDTVREVIATSDAIRYIQLGNPETILIGTIQDLPEGVRERLSHLGDLKPVWKFEADTPPGLVDMMALIGQHPYGKWQGSNG